MPQLGQPRRRVATAPQLRWGHEGAEHGGLGAPSGGVTSSAFLPPAGAHHFLESSFLIATLAKPRLQGSELRLQQHFRWVTLRWDQEPLHGLLGRHLCRKVLRKVSGAAKMNVEAFKIKY